MYSVDLWNANGNHNLNGIDSYKYRMGNSTLTFQRPVLIATVILLFGFTLLLYMSFSGYSNRNKYHEHDNFVPVPDLQNLKYNATYPLTKPISVRGVTRYKIGIITDLDKESKDQNTSTWFSYFKTGYLTVNIATNKYEIEWDTGSNDKDMTKFKSRLNFDGRGMELSELIVFNGKLYTVDDRTGVVYQINGSNVYPWVILADGTGAQTKGFKSEWATVKDRHLYIGGLGKEWTTPDGEVLNFNPMYIKKISPMGEVTHINWREKYLALREKANIEFPGYMIHEACAWSKVHSKWFFLPRRASKYKYNDIDDEMKGTNLLLSLDDVTNEVNLKEIGTLEYPSHGFSSFKFVPGTSDRVIIAIKSEELKGTIASYLMIFDIDGTIYYPETKIGDHKYEGIEFI